MALLAGGGYAQQVAVPAGQVLRIPDGVDLVTAASLPEVAATVYSNLIMTAQLQPGETVLIHGATGGIGTMAIQLAKAVGARVATTAGQRGKGRHRQGVPRGGHRHQLRGGGLPGEPARPERRQGRGRHPRRRRGQIPRAEHRCAGRLRTARGDRAAGRRQGRNWTSASCCRNGPPSSPRRCVPARSRKRP